MPENINYNVNQSKSGMDLNSRDGELQPTSYRILVNGNIQSKDGAMFTLTNEPSNILCSKFKLGYKVLNVTTALSLNKTFFFLVNPVTNESEIGEITNISFTEINDRQYSCDTCNNPTMEDPPLEKQKQVENCNYLTLVNANCLQFSINHPIKTSIKIDDCTIRIYFTDGTDTGLRYIDYDYQKKTISNCPIVETTELDCAKIKVFKDTCYPKINYVIVRAGGSNKAGTLQFAISYADATGNTIGNYFFVSNPIPLFDQPITDITDYIVNQVIQLKISDLSTEFTYFNIAVIKTVNLVSAAYLVATLSVTGQDITYNYSGVDKNIIRTTTPAARAHPWPLDRG